MPRRELDSQSEHSSMPPPVRQPHAVLDLRSRQWKAIKIERLLQLDRRPGPIRLLEVGTGSGGIAHYFGTHPTGRFTVEAVDVVDSRMVVEGYRFTAVADTRLPFEEASFDVVLSNHVIEHVGAEQEQRRHLAELRRVLRRDGIGYLAVPNRWMLVEPHYRLAFLSWWPKSWRSPYLKLMARGAYYDCEPLELGQVERLLGNEGFGYRNVCIEALRETFEIEHEDTASTRLLRKIPDIAFLPLRRIIPTLIYTFWRNA